MEGRSSSPSGCGQLTDLLNVDKLIMDKKEIVSNAYMSLDGCTNGARGLLMPELSDTTHMQGYYIPKTDDIGCVWCAWFNKFAVHN